MAENPHELGHPSRLKFFLDGNMHRLVFRYEYQEDVLFGFEKGFIVKDGTGKRELTYCAVQQLVGEDWLEIAEGMAIRHPSDEFVKSAGRKHALAAVLKTIGFSREERLEIWKCYHSRGKNGTPMYGELKLNNGTRPVAEGKNPTDLSVVESIKERAREILRQGIEDVEAIGV